MTLNVLDSVVSLDSFASSFQCRGEVGKSLFLDNVPDFVKNSYADSSPRTAREEAGLPLPGQRISHSPNLPTAGSKRLQVLLPARNVLLSMRWKE